MAAAVLLAAGCATDGDDPTLTRATTCEWRMGAATPSHLGVQTCEGRIGRDTVGQLEQRWFFRTSDTVTATPAVADGVAYVGDWAGQAFAIDLERGEAAWTADLSDPTPVVYAGQITAPAALADAGSTPVVVFASGPRVVALDRRDGSIVWERAVGEHDPDDPADPTEIEGAPTVAGDVVVVGFDAHNSPGRAGGVAAIDLRTGELRWQWIPPAGREGCADVWGSPSVDERDDLVVVGTGNCPGSPAAWGRHSEAMVGLDLSDGSERWVYQPHPPGNDDLDFAGAPNLFEIDGREVAGLGNKDGRYYVVDRSSGIAVWQAELSGPTITRRGSNFSTGGLIGPSAVVDGVIVATSAGDDGPFLHGIDAETGRIRWQLGEASASYAGVSAIAGVAFTGGTDFTLRAIDVRDGSVLWSHEMPGVVAAAPAVLGDRVVAVAGLREPGSEDRSTASGVTLFAFPDDSAASAATTTTAAPPDLAPLRLEPSEQECVGAPCTVGFQFKSPPSGLTPTITVQVDPDPFRLRVTATGLGPPAGWPRPDGPSAATGATVYGVVLSASDDDALSAGVACVLDAAGGCDITDLPKRTPTYRRVTVMALADAATAPTLADGYDRLVVTHSFDPPLQEVRS